MARPWHPKSTLDVGADLRAQTKDEPAVRRFSEVPGNRCHRHGTAGEGDGNGGSQRQALGVLRSDGQLQERIVFGLECPESGYSR